MDITNISKALFNREYYLSNNADLRQAEQISEDQQQGGSTPLFDPYSHFIRFGQYEGRSPSPLFSESYYLEHNPDVAAAHVSGFEHFITYGADEGRNPTPFFDNEYYLAANPDVANAHVNAFEHFLTYGEEEGRNPSYLFDGNYYLANNQDVANAHVNAFQHFITYGMNEGRNPTAFFNTAYYLANNQDVAVAGINPFLHYLQYGQFENRAPSADFSASSYLSANPDVAAAVANGTLSSAIEHYILFGKAEGRQLSIQDNTHNDNDNNGGNDTQGGGNDTQGGGNDTQGGGNDTQGGGDNTGGDGVPVNSVPGEQHVTAGEILLLEGLAVSDSDSTELTVTLTAGNGILLLKTNVIGGVSADNIYDNGTGSVTLTGTPEAINATLSAASGVQYLAEDTYSGSTQITMVTEDGASSDTDTVTVIVDAAEGIILSLTADSDDLSAETGAVIFSTSQSTFDETDTLTGGSDSDTLLFTDTADITPDNMLNKSGIDVIRLSSDNNNIILDDTIVNLSDNGEIEINNRIFTVTYLDTSNVFSPNRVIIGGTGAVTLADDVDNSITLKDGVNTTIIDGTGSDTILGGTGNDSITLLAGDNSILGGEGDDTIYGDIDSFSGFNTIDGGDGRDTLYSHDILDIDWDKEITGIEVLVPSADDSHLILSDMMVSSAEDATIEIHNGGYTISMLDTSDISEDGRVVIMGSGMVVLADGVNNRVYAGDENGVSIIGGNGDDSITGGAQDDTLTGGEGADILTGGDGADQFVFMAVSDSLDSNPDMITDFNSSEDVIVLTGLGFTGITDSEESQEADMLLFSHDGENTIITDASGNFALIIAGVVTDLSSDNILF